MLTDKEKEAVFVTLGMILKMEKDGRVSEFSQEFREALESAKTKCDINYNVFEKIFND